MKREEAQTGIAGALRSQWPLKSQAKDWHAQDKMWPQLSFTDCVVVYLNPGDLLERYADSALAMHTPAAVGDPRLLNRR